MLSIRSNQPQPATVSPARVRIVKGGVVLENEKMTKSKANPSTSPRYGGKNGKLLELKLSDGGNCFIDATKVTAIVALPAVIGDNIPARTRIEVADGLPILVAGGAGEVACLVELYVKATN